MTGGAKEYALAMFAIAMENDSMVAVHDDLVVVKQAISENPGYMEYLVNPAIPKSERIENIAMVFESRVCEDVFAFLNILCEHGDMYSLNPIIDEFCTMYESYMRFSKAVVTSAVELTEEEKTKLIAKLEKVTNKKIQAEYYVDPALLGGVTIDVDGKFFDGSVRKNLRNLKEVIS